LVPAGVSQQLAAWSVPRAAGPPLAAPCSTAGTAQHDDQASKHPATNTQQVHPCHSQLPLTQPFTLTCAVPAPAPLLWRLHQGGPSAALCWTWRWPAQRGLSPGHLPRSGAQCAPGRVTAQHAQHAWSLSAMQPACVTCAATWLQPFWQLQVIEEDGGDAMTSALLASSRSPCAAGPM
jgi:hypothetical protein